MSLEDRLRSAREALAHAVDPDPSPDLLEHHSTAVAARRKRRNAVLGAVTALAVVSVTVALIGDDGSTQVATTLEREAGTQVDRAGPVATADAEEPISDAERMGDDVSPTPPPGGAGATDGPPATADSSASPPAHVCQNFVDHPSTDDDAITDHEQVGSDQDRYMGDAQTAQRYGQEHPDDFVGVQFLNSPEVRLGIAFTRNLAAHCESLRALLEHPDDFELWQLPWSERELRRVQDEAGTTAGELLRSSGFGFGGPVEVHLRADGERVARDLRERFNEMVDLQVGLHRYPPDRATSPAPACAGAPPTQDGATEGVDAELDLDEADIVRGRDGTGTLTVTNRGLGTISVSMEPRRAHVIEPGSDRPSAVHDAGTAGPDVGYEDRELRTGESASIPVTFATPACDLAHGYALRAGDYHVVTTVQIVRGGQSTLVRSSPASLRVRS